ncbi:MAG: hypothetical protein MUF30_07050 [Burkholderiales bacterium]|nr:hypothetical protein [Burkholderiales bacterium]
MTPDLLVVQPWFGAPGHPAQSTLQTARVLAGGPLSTGWLLARDPRAEPPALAAMADAIGRTGPTWRYPVAQASLRAGTWRAIGALARLRRDGVVPAHVLFLDGHLALLALAWPWARRAIGTHAQVGLLYLAGPERIAATPGLRGRVAALLRDPRFTLFLRTDELRDAWRSAFGAARRIDTLPSLELAADPHDVAAPATVPVPRTATTDADVLRVAVLGQLRPGKGLDWLVPRLRDRADVTLTVAGPFFDSAHRAALPMLADLPGLQAGWHPEATLLAIARAQDWPLMLYDGWDARMEAATLFLAARADTPVVAVDAGWCGRMLTGFGVGIGVAPGTRPDADWFAALPRRADARHARYRDGLARFREACGPTAMRARFVAAFTAPG